MQTGHTIKNVLIPENVAGLFSTLTGEIKNLNIKNYMQNSKSTNNVGMIATASSGSTIDNVHVDGIEISTKKEESSTYIGGIVGYGDNVLIKNSSVTNLKITIEGKATILRAGGLIGGGSNIKILNSFAQDINFDIQRVLQYAGIGGIIGRDTGIGGTIQYCYATGSITTDAELVGGIYGFSNSLNVKNNYSIVDITSKTDYLGGIGGYNNNTQTNSTSYNLSLGKLYSDKTSQYISRTIGNNANEENNYAYKGQLINGFTSEERLDAEELLTATELTNQETYLQLLHFGNNFNYEQLNEYILPKLYHTNGVDLLPNQKDHKLEVGNLLIEEVEAQKTNDRTILARVMIENPGEIEVKDLKIENMELEITNIVNSEGKTYIYLTANPLKAYDSYRITSITYLNGIQEETIEQSAKLDIQFYNEINNFEDWQKIDSESAQNYRLMVDLDFTDKINPNMNVSIGRLEGEGQGHTIKNLNITINQKTRGMIREIKNSLKNISFENITITNTASGSYTGLIVRSVGEIENVNFRDITIFAPKMSYVGIISNNSAYAIKNVTLNNIEIQGVGYVGGFIGRSESGDYRKIVGNNIKVTATSSYVGGIIGNIVYRDLCTMQEISIQKSNVKGLDYVGGIFGNGKGANLSVSETNVSGRNRVGGVIGQIDNNSRDNRYYYFVDSTVSGTGTYIGGIGGINTGYLYYCFVLGSNVIGNSTSCNYVGGLLGQLNGWELIGSGTVNTKVQSKASNVGGLIGYCTGWVTASYSQDCIVEGISNVGGFIGQQRQGYIRYNYASNTVTATSHSAGGMIGYLNNENMTGANYFTNFYQNYVAHSVIIAPTKVGGLFGRIYEELYDSRYFQNNYVEVDLKCNTQQVSIGVGSNGEQNAKLSNFYVYEGCKINGQKVDATQSYIQKSQMLNLADLKKSSTYSSKLHWNTNYFNYALINQNKYPTVKNGATVIPNQKGIALPSEVEELSKETLKKTRMANMLLKRGEQANKNTLPEVEVYPVSANEVNIEFSNLEGDAYFSYNEETDLVKVQPKAYTFSYDYQTSIQLMLGNEYQSKQIRIEPEEIKSKVSIVEDDYYYLTNHEISNKGQRLQGEFVNLYEEEALEKDGKIYHLTNHTTSEVVTKGLTLKEKAKAMESDEYQSYQIETYAKISKIIEKEEKDEKEEKTKNKEIERQGQIFVRNGNLSIVSPSVEKQTNGQIIGTYNGKEYETILGTDKKLHDLKTRLNYPEGFKNEKIEQVVTSNQSDRTIAMLYYQSGRVYVFDYILKEVLYDNNIKEQISLYDYVLHKFDFDVVSDEILKNNEKDYEEAQKLVEKLEKKPVWVAMQEINTKENGNKIEDNSIQNKVISNDIVLIENPVEANGNSIKTNIDIPKSNKNHNENNPKMNLGINKESEEAAVPNKVNRYITVYNQDTNQYDIYSEEEVLDIKTTEVISENEKIEQQVELSKYYEEENKMRSYAINGLILVSITIMSIMITLYILRKRKA